MMSKQRASVFDTAAELDVSGFAPEAAPDTGPDRDTIRAVSAQSNFPSREPRPARAVAQAPAPTTKRQPRRHRTGRTAQFNARTTPETVEAFYAIADRQGWLVGETVERALAALRRELGEGA
jgi:hypothetical protein